MGRCFENPRQTAELTRFEKLIKDHTEEVYKHLLEQDGKIAEMVCKFDGNIEKTVYAYLLKMERSGKLQDVITDTLLNDVLILEHKTAGFVNVKEFGAAGDGLWDDTEAIQAAIDYANEHGRAVNVPAGVYLISAPIELNGCSLFGTPGNIFNSAGTVFKCAANDFAAIKQGSTGTRDIMFNISDIVVDGAAKGFEIVYAINSKFERLYAINCNTGFKIGDPSAVGCMFCEFNNLYTRNCSVAVEISSAEYMNNNRFNNGFLEGDDKALDMRVAGGYGAVANVFNNVEFKSKQGRGAVLNSCVNTVFNSCYFECAGNAIRFENYCSVTINNGTFGLFKIDNVNSDVNTIYAAGGVAITVNGGVVFTTAEYNNHKFYGAANPETYQNIEILKNIVKNGSATGLVFFEKATRMHEQTALTGTVVVPAEGTATAEFTYEMPFASVPPIMCVAMRGAEGAERGLSYCLSERTATGGKISISNTSTGQRSVSFSVYAKSGV